MSKTKCEEMVQGHTQKELESALRHFQHAVITDYEIYFHTPFPKRNVSSRIVHWLLSTAPDSTSKHLNFTTNGKCNNDK